MMHKISRHLEGEYDCYFSPFYTTGVYRFLQDLGTMDFTILGGQQKALADEYMRTHEMVSDYGGNGHDYDLVVTCTDLIVQENIKDKPIVLVQEGMTDPETIWFHVAKALHRFGFPRWVASTSTTGLSDAYRRFCVASEGYKDLFVRKGVREEKITVTGIPNYDNAEAYRQNDIEIKDYVLACTSDIRENFGYDNRRAFILRVKELAQGKQVVFKLHPNENVSRSTREIINIIPDALVVPKGNAHHYVANCSVLVTQYSTLAYTGLALGKEVYSYFNVEELKRLVPLQNGGASASNIAQECRGILG